MTTTNPKTPLLARQSQSKNCYSILCSFLFNPRNHCAFFILVAIGLGSGSAVAVNAENYTLGTGLFAGSFASIVTSAYFFQKANAQGRQEAVPTVDNPENSDIRNLGLLT